MSPALTFYLRELRCRFGHAWRRLAFRPRPGLRLPQESWDGLFPAESEASRAADALRAAYRLDWPDDPENQRENLHVVGLLDAALAPVAAALPGTLDVLDIGAKDWHYLPGLARCLRHMAAPTPRRVRLRGVELDPYFRYRDGFTRYDYAQAYAAGLEAQYVAGDAMAEAGAFDLVLLLHPFWRRRDLLDWGLPAADYDVKDLLRHARRRVKAGGWLVVSAYDSERTWAEGTLAELGWEARTRGVWRTPFLRAATSHYWVFPAIEPAREISGLPV